MNKWQQINNLSDRKIDSIIYDNVDEIIRFGEFSPSQAVIAKAVDALIEVHGAGIIYEALDGDDRFAELILTDPLQAQIVLHNKMQKTAQHYLASREHIAWLEYENQKMPSNN